MAPVVFRRCYFNFFRLALLGSAIVTGWTDPLAVTASDHLVIASPDDAVADAIGSVVAIAAAAADVDVDVDDDATAPAKDAALPQPLRPTTRSLPPESNTVRPPSDRQLRPGRSLLASSSSPSSSSSSSCPASLDEPLINDDFENDTGLGYPADWYANYYRAYASNPDGAPHSHVYGFIGGSGSGNGNGSGNGDYSRYANFDRRTESWHGLTHDLDPNCIDGDAIYVFKARVRIDKPNSDKDKEDDDVDDVGASPSSNCHANHTNCLYLMLYMSDMDPSAPSDPTKNVRRYVWLGGQTQPSQDHEWFDLSIRFQFVPEAWNATAAAAAVGGSGAGVGGGDSGGDGGIVRRSIFMAGPEAGVEINVDDVSLTATSRTATYGLGGGGTEDGAE